MIRALVLLAMVGAALPAEARPCRVVKHVAAVQTLVVTPFAVPVGVPVATLGTVAYSYGSAAGAYTAAPAAATAAPSSALCNCPQCGAHADQPAPGSPPEPVGPEAVFGPSSTREPAGAQVLRKRCAGCHSGQAAKGNLRLFDGGAWADGWRASGRAIFTAIREGTMPKGGPPLTDEEFTAVAEFLIGE